MHAPTLFLLAMSALTASAAPAPAPVSDHKVDGYAHHREKEPERYSFLPEFYDAKRYHRTPKSPPYGKDFVYYDGGYDGGRGRGKGKDDDDYKKEKKWEKEKKFDKEKKESKHDKDKFSKKVEEDEKERFKKEKEKEKEEESRKFEERAESKSEEVCDEQCCFEEGFGNSSFFFW